MFQVFLQYSAVLNTCRTVSLPPPADVGPPLQSLVHRAERGQASRGHVPLPRRQPPAAAQDLRGRLPRRVVLQAGHRRRVHQHRLRLLVRRERQRQRRLDADDLADHRDQ